MPFEPRRHRTGGERPQSQFLTLLQAVLCGKISNNCVTRAQMYTADNSWMVNCHFAQVHKTILLKLPVIDGRDHRSMTLKMSNAQQQFEPRGAGTPLFLHASVSKWSLGHFEFPALWPRATKVAVYWRRACALCTRAERVVCYPHFQVQLSRYWFWWQWSRNFAALWNTIARFN